MITAFMDSLFLLVAFAAALVIEAGIQVCVPLRWFKNHLLSLIE